MSDTTAPEEAPPEGSSAAPRRPIVLQATLIDDEHNQQLTKNRLQQRRRKKATWISIIVIVLLLGAILGTLFGVGVFENASSENLNVTAAVTTPTPSFSPSNQLSISPSFSPSPLPSSEPTISSLPTNSQAPTRFSFSPLGGIVSSSAINGDRFGESVALSNDGLVLAVGSPGFTPNATLERAGAIFFYVWEEGWQSLEIGFSVMGEYPQQGFGVSVSLNDDGTLLAVSSGNDGPRNYDRAPVASVYEFDSSQKTLLQRGGDLSRLDNLYDHNEVGVSTVTISGDGQVVVVGYQGLRNEFGYVQRYEYNGTDWLSVGISLPGKDSGDDFGTSVALSTDGTIMAVGANGNAAYVQVWRWNISEVEWIRHGQDIVSSLENDRFGSAVDLSKDGSVLVVGAPHIRTFQDYQFSGYIQVFQWDRTQWNMKGQNITLEEEAYNRLGHSVAISDDGNTIAIGVPSQDTIAGVDSGRVQSWQWDGSDWITRGFPLRGNYADGHFGESVALSGDASILAVGVPGTGGMNSPLSGQVQAFN